jgi:hypothetical protein
MDRVIDDEQLDKRPGNLTAAEILYVHASSHHSELRNFQDKIRDKIK